MVNWAWNVVGMDGVDGVDEVHRVDKVEGVDKVNGDAKDSTAYAFPVLINSVNLSTSSTVPVLPPTNQRHQLYLRYEYWL